VAHTTISEHVCAELTPCSTSQAVNTYLDAHPPQQRAQQPRVLSEHGGAPPVIDAEEVRNDLSAMSVKELKKFLSVAEWSLQDQNITEKAELVNYALKAACATGNLPPKRPAPKPPPAPEPRLVNFEDQEDAEPAAALRNYVAGQGSKDFVAPPVHRTKIVTSDKSGLFPPVVDVSVKRQEKELNDMVLLVLKSAQTAQASHLESVLESTCIPTAHEESTGMACERLAGFFADCAENNAPHGMWGETREALQALSAAAVVALRRDKDEDYQNRQVETAARWQKGKEEQVGRLSEDGQGEETMEKLIAQTKARRELCATTMDHIRKLAESRPTGIQIKAVASLHQNLREHQVDIEAKVRTEFETKTEKRTTLHEVISHRNLTLAQIAQQEDELFQSQLLATEESQVEALVELDEQVKDLLAERQQVTTTAARESARLKTLFDRHGDNMVKWEGIQRAASETQSLLDQLQRHANRFVEVSCCSCSEREASNEAGLAAHLLEAARLQKVMTQVLNEKQAHIQETMGSTRLVLQAESPQSAAMASVLEALSGEKRLLEGRLNEIKQHVEADASMLEELCARGNNALDLAKVARAQRTVLDLMASPLDDACQVKAEPKEDPSISCHAMAGRTSGTNLEEMGRNSFGNLEQTA